MSLTLLPLEEQAAQFPFGAVNLPSWEVFALTQHSYACVNLKPVVPGHVLVCPRRKVLRFADVEGAELADLFLLAQRVGIVMQKQHDAPSLTIAIQDGPEAGQTVKHVHVHIIPRKGNDFPQNDDVYRELDRHDKEPERPSRSKDQMREEAALLRQRFYTTSPTARASNGAPESMADCATVE